MNLLLTSRITLREVGEEDPCSRYLARHWCAGAWTKCCFVTERDLKFTNIHTSINARFPSFEYNHS